MIRGTAPRTVERAIETDDALPGTTGFAGRLPDGRLVRDVLGREPLFAERGDPTAWAFEPTDLDHPRSVPAGAVVDDGGTVHEWSLPSEEPVPEAAALATLRESVRHSLDAVDPGSLAIGFSGGVDSALLAAAIDAPLYTVGFPGSHDLEAARTVADLLGARLTVRELALDDLEAAVPEVARAIDRTNAMDVQIALPLWFLARAVAEDGYERLALGQGADELFGGYSKVEALDHRVDADTVRGARREVLASLPDQAERDVLAVRSAGVEPITPFLHDRVVEAALRLPASLVVADGVRKRGFRMVAADHLPDSVAQRPKKAMQYGSLVARELDRLARRAGYKRRMDDHVSRYVGDRCRES